MIHTILVLTVVFVVVMFLTLAVRKHSLKGDVSNNGH
jgi:hypothetical protein